MRQALGSSCEQDAKDKTDYTKTICATDNKVYMISYTGDSTCSDSTKLKNMVCMDSCMNPTGHAWYQKAYCAKKPANIKQTTTRFAMGVQMYTEANCGGTAMKSYMI